MSCVKKCMLENNRLHKIVLSVLFTFTILPTYWTLFRSSNANPMDLMKQSL